MATEVLSPMQSPRDIKESRVPTTPSTTASLDSPPGSPPVTALESPTASVDNVPCFPMFAVTSADLMPASSVLEMIKSKLKEQEKQGSQSLVDVSSTVVPAPADPVPLNLPESSVEWCKVSKDAESDLFELKDKLCEFRLNEDRSKEAVEETLCIVEQLSLRPMSVAQLRKTKLGMEMSNRFLVQHPSAEVARASHALVLKWKALVPAAPQSMTERPKTSKRRPVEPVRFADPPAKERERISRRQIREVSDLPPPPLAKSHIAWSTDEWEPTVQVPSTVEHIRQSLSEKLEQAEKLRHTVEQRRARLSVDASSEDEAILAHYDEVRKRLEDEAEELTRQLVN